MINHEHLHQTGTQAEQVVLAESLQRGSKLEQAPDNAVIGPNAIIQLQVTLRQQLSWQDTQDIFAAAAVAHYLQQAPVQMVDEREVARLHRQVRLHCQPGHARAIMITAGDLTGQYILNNRIPKPVVWLLRRLPARLSALLLQRAIDKHAWTFAGSGSFTIGPAANAPAGVITASIAHNPVVALETSDAPICHWHAAVLQRLFRELVSVRTTVTETHCCAAGDAACQFRISFCSNDADAQAESAVVPG